MNRRIFLKSVGALSLSPLSGCLTLRPEQRPLFEDTGIAAAGQVLRSLSPTARDAHRKRLGYEVNEEAWAAYSELYAQIQQALNTARFGEAPRLPPLRIHGQGVSADAAQDVSALLSEINALPETLSDEQMAELWPRIKPYVLAAASANQAGGSGSGVTKREPVVLTDSHEILLQPGQTAIIRMKGACADKVLPAFIYQDLLTLRPTKDFIGRDRYGAAQMALLKYAAENPQAIPYHDLQFMLWGLQGKEANGSPYYLEALMRRRDLLDKLDAASPGTSATLRGDIQMSGALQALANALRSKLPPEAQRLLGDSRIVDLLANPQESSRFIQQEIERMAGVPAPRDNGVEILPKAAYSTLAPGVWAHAIGGGSLIANVTMTNTSGMDFVFRPYEYTAETKSNKQRGLFTTFSYAKIYTHPVWQAVETAEAIASTIRLGKALAKKGLGLPGYRPGHPVYDRHAKVVERLHRALLPVFSGPVAREIAGILPVIGNIKAAFDLFDPEASASDRILAAFGLIPGIGSLVKITGSAGRAAKLAKRIVKSAKDGYLARAREMVEFVNDLENASELLNIRLDERDRDKWEKSFAILKDLVPAAV